MNGQPDVTTVFVSLHVAPRSRDQAMCIPLWPALAKVNQVAYSEPSNAPLLVSIASHGLSVRPAAFFAASTPLHVAPPSVER